MPKRVNYGSHAHFRVPSWFMDKVHDVAERQGLSAAGFMRMAIIREMHRSEPISVTEGNRYENVEVNFG